MRSDRLIRPVSAGLVAVLIAGLLAFGPVRAAALSVGEEKKLGKEVATKFLAQLGEVEDPAAREFIRDIGNRIVRANQPQLFDFEFYLIDHPAINAFAVPGGYIFVHSGLVLRADSEEEIAGVIAHEIGHVTARHISQQIERSTKVNLLSMAAILGAVFLANDPKTAAAVSAAALAGSASAQLSYSREMEEQADRLGFQYLTNAGYNPEGLVVFMQKIMAENVFADLVPSYLTTHPDPARRAVYLSGLVESEKGHLPPPVDRTRFERIRTRLIVDQKDVDQAEIHFRGRVAEAPDDPNGYYGHALTYQKMGRVADAFDQYEKALALAPDDADIVRDYGVCQLLAGDADAAIAHLKRAGKLKPTDGYALYYLGLAQKEQGRFEEAATTLQRAVMADPENAQSLYHLGIALGTLGKECRAYYYLGLYHRKIGDMRQARDFFERARGVCPSEDEFSIKTTTEIGELPK